MDDARQGWTSASNAEADAKCPGAHLACRGLPEIVSDDAMSGTFIHAWLAGNPITPLSADEQEVADACLRIKDQMVAEWSNGQPYTEFKEERLWTAVGDFQHSGQADLICIQDHRAAVYDFKSGRNEVAEPNTNLQLRDLAVLAAMRWPLHEVTVAIVQPFSARQPPCVYDENDLQQALTQMRRRVKASNNPLSPRIAGEKQCKYCRAKTRCAEYRAWTNQVLTVVAAAQLPTTPWTTEKWQTFLYVAPEAEKWIEERKSEAKRLLAENPDSIPGYKLETRERDTVTNPQGVFNEATAKGVTLGSFMQAVNITKKGLKTALRSAGFKGRDLDNAMEACLNGNVTTKETEPMIVKAKI